MPPAPGPRPRGSPARPPAPGGPRTSLCVWLLRAAAAAAAAAAAGPGHSCLALAGREAEVQQQQLLTRQWLPRPHTLRATPPLRPAPRPSPAAPGGRGPGAPGDPGGPAWGPGAGRSRGSPAGSGDGCGREEPRVTGEVLPRRVLGKGWGRGGRCGGKDGTLLARTWTPPQK